MKVYNLRGDLSPYHSSYSRFYLSSILIILLTPLLLVLVVLIALVLKIQTKGPLFYSQKRVGLHHREFVIYKFRTMYIDAESNGLSWTQQDDSRITPFGNLLRKSHLDELPQLINILKGEMQLIGPRPERKEFCELIAQEIPDYDIRHSVLPGITGWAQVHQVYSASVDEAKLKHQYDLDYLSRASLWIDLKIICLTFRDIILAKGR